MSATDCSNDGHCEQRKPPYRRALAAVLLFVILVLLLILIIWLILRPSKPKFFLQDASVSHLNLTSSTAPATSLLTTVMQVTLSSRNPNSRVGVYYDALAASAAYTRQRITAAAVLPAGYQGHNDVAVWSPFLYGAAVPVSPYLAASLAQDQAAGLVLVEVRVEGRLRWKVGTWVSAHYRLQANCPAFLTIDSGKDNGGSPAFHFQQVSLCTVDV